MNVSVVHQKYKFNIDPVKYKKVILFLIKECGGKIVGKKKLAKLLYFVEFDYFERYDEPLLNDVFKRYPMGPVPANYETIVAELVEEELITHKSEEFSTQHNPVEIFGLIGSETDFDGLSIEETDMIHRVANLYGGCTGKELESISHSEAPWNAVEDYEIIDIELAYYRNTEFGDDSEENRLQSEL